jgi:AraC-like DNA-binding protein
MQLGSAPLLERHRIFRNCCVEEARAWLEHKEFHLDEIDPRRAGELDMRINGVYLPGMWLGYFQYNLPVAIRGVGRDDYWVQLPVCGQIEAIGSSSSIVCDTRRAAVLSPTRTDFYLVRSAGCTGRLCLSLTKASLLAQLVALLGETPNRALEFRPELDVTLGHGRSLVRHVLMAIFDLESSGSMLGNPLALNSFAQFIMTALLLSHPHSYSDALGRLDGRIAPRDVRRAIDYIEAHLDQPITVADIVEATGVAGRTLFMHFRDFKGISPMRYLRDARLRKVRQMLLRADPGASVTDIAMSVGFSHMGRFSVEYRRRFGESPSQTLKRRKLPEARTESIASECQQRAQRLHKPVETR